MGKLLRFNNYRRLILNKMPGPQPQPREEHLWYTTYDAEIDGQEQTPSGVSPQEPSLSDAEEAQGNMNDTLGNLSLQKHLQEDVQKVSEERSTPNDYIDRLEKFVRFGDSPKGEEGGGSLPNRVSVIGNKCVAKVAIRKTQNLQNEDGKTNSTSQSSLVSEKNCMEQPIKRERADLEAQAQAFVQRAMAASQTTQARTAERSQSTGANTPQNQAKHPGE